MVNLYYIFCVYVLRLWWIPLIFVNTVCVCIGILYESVCLSVYMYARMRVGCMSI